MRARNDPPAPSTVSVSSTSGSLAASACAPAACADDSADSILPARQYRRPGDQPNARPAASRTAIAARARLRMGPDFVTSSGRRSPAGQQNTNFYDPATFDRTRGPQPQSITAIASSRAHTFGVAWIDVVTLRCNVAISAGDRLTPRAVGEERIHRTFACDGWGD